MPRASQSLTLHGPISPLSNTISALHTAPGLSFKGEEKTQYVYDFLYYYQDSVNPQDAGLTHISFEQVSLDLVIRYSVFGTGI